MAWTRIRPTYEAFSGRLEESEYSGVKVRIAQDCTFDGFPKLNDGG